VVAGPGRLDGCALADFELQRRLLGRHELALAKAAARSTSDGWRRWRRTASRWRLDRHRRGRGRQPRRPRLGLLDLRWSTAVRQRRPVAAPNLVACRWWGVNEADTIGVRGGIAATVGGSEPAAFLASHGGAAAITAAAAAGRAPPLAAWALPPRASAVQLRGCWPTWSSMRVLPPCRGPCRRRARPRAG